MRILLESMTVALDGQKDGSLYFQLHGICLVSNSCSVESHPRLCVLLCFEVLRIALCGENHFNLRHVYGVGSRN